MGVPVLYAGSHYKPVPFVPIPPPPPPAPVPLLDLEADTQALGALAIWIGEESAHNQFTQNAGAARPTVQMVGGYKTVVFDGTDDYMIGPDIADNLDSFTAIAVSDMNLYCIVSKMNNVTTGAGWALFLYGRSGFIQEDGGDHWIEKDLATDTSIAVNTLQLISKSEMHVYTNGDNSTESDSSSPPVNNYSTTEPVRLGVFGDFAQFTAGSLYALQIYTPALSPTDRAAVEAELASRYGITL